MPRSPPASAFRRRRGQIAAAARAPADAKDTSADHQLAGLFERIFYAQAGGQPRTSSPRPVGREQDVGPEREFIGENGIYVRRAARGSALANRMVWNDPLPQKPRYPLRVGGAT